MGNRTIQDLQMMQAAPLNAKIAMTKRRIRDWVNEFGLDEVYVSFSGGKDSTVLLTIARQEYPKMKAMFLDTGLEFPEIRDFVKTWGNVDWVRPKMNFRQVIAKYGYPFISKEVAECVWGARKYLTSVAESTAALNERTNERTNERHKWHFQKYRQLCGMGEYRQRDKVAMAQVPVISGPSKDNRQYPGPAVDGDSAGERKSDMGDYP